MTTSARVARTARPSRRRQPAQGSTVAPTPEPAPELGLPGQAAAVWITVVAALEQSGFAQAGPEYLKLSRILLEQRAIDFARGVAADEQWLALRKAATEALVLLEPLYQAATRLTQLPIDAVPAELPWDTREE